MKITTNNHPRPLVPLGQLTLDEREGFGYLDHLTAEDDETYTSRFFRYCGGVYDFHEFIRIERRSDPLRGGFTHQVDDDSPLLAWAGIQTDSAFSATLVRCARDWDGTQDDEAVVVGSYLT